MYNNILRNSVHVRLFSGIYNMYFNLIKVHVIIQCTCSFKTNV